MSEKGDFTAQTRLLWISALAVAVGAACAGVAFALLWLIACFTNLFWFGQFSGVMRPPAASTLGWLGIFVPVVGGLVIGLMARFGSDRIRGHGIPEAIEAILIGQSRMSPKVAVLKPLSSAVSIGSGGPFGAEGPIIMTGGAFGSLIAQLFHLTAAERKTLLVAGAAGGMAATFGTPVAAVLLAVELLLFEWKPRSLVPVALASAVAVLLRPYLLGPGPLFPVPPHGRLGPDALLSSAAAGVFAGALALTLTAAVYAAEDFFHRLPVHWMWWPALGGLVVGVGGYYQPRALGVGYDLIEDLLQGRYVLAALVPLMLVKAVIWSLSLGSGTSGGVLAPLLILGGSLGALASGLLPGGDTRLWPLVGMAAVLGGTMRSPLTGALFALELTHDVNALPALLLSSVVAYGFTVLLMKRSILTEKVARRGYHVSREYSVDPLELTAVSEVMASPVVTVPAGLPVGELLGDFFLSGSRKHQGYPVVDASGQLLGVVTRSDVLEAAANAATTAGELVCRSAVTVFAEESCRSAAEHMARSGVGRLVVVAADDRRRLVGIVTRSDLLKPRRRSVEEESERERFLWFGRRKAAAPGLVASRVRA
jgi:H+/Cl- antiporter ClcA/CBS domain-containing protein